MDELNTLILTLYQDPEALGYATPETKGLLFYRLLQAKQRRQDLLPRVAFALRDLKRLKQDLRHFDLDSGIDQWQKILQNVGHFDGKGKFVPIDRAKQQGSENGGQKVDQIFQGHQFMFEFFDDQDELDELEAHFKTLQ